MGHKKSGILIFFSKKFEKVEISFWIFFLGLADHSSFLIVG